MDSIMRRIISFQEDDDWAFVAMVLDRLLLYVFGAVSILGTILILCESPFLYDYTRPIDADISTVFGPNP